MVSISFLGGLGNQMFQYALARNLSYKLGVELKFNNSFNLNRKDFDPSDILFIYDIFDLIGSPISEKDEFNLLKINETSLEFNHHIFSLKSNISLYGYWQSEKYFKENASLIKNDFTFKNSIESHNISIASEINKTNSVSIHLRGRDYINKPSTKKIHNTCDAKYYIDSIKYILRHVQDPYFYIFSDDLDWARSFFKDFECQHKFIEGNSWNKNSFEDMRLMSLCKYNIIANSSFSWWSAWLNKNPNKIVIAPHRWFAPSEMNKTAKDLVPEEWIKI